MIAASKSGGRPGAGPARSHRLQSLSEIVKFTALAAALAIFIDAAIAHAMIWGNDPYWTYWVTDTLLMATVFGLGTMLFGIGLGRGAAITAVHVLLLTIYYWTLSPIGLPSSPEWLDLERTWITGLPIHLAVYYFGYVGAFWLWRCRSREGRIAADASANESVFNPLFQVGLAGLVLTISLVIATGIVQAILLQDFPGFTWFIMRIAILFPFTIGWWLLAGNRRTTAPAAGIVAALLLTTYGHFLGPVGLPNESLRLLAEDSPGASVHWLSYRQEFLIMLPIIAVLASLVYWLAARWRGSDDGAEPAASGPTLWSAVVAGAALVVAGILAAPHLGPEANRATLGSVGPATVEYGGGIASQGVAASLGATVENRNTHRTPLPPHDAVDLVARITGPDGAVHVVRATQPMVADARGRFTTWQGVTFGRWHDGRSGIGLSHLPPIYSDVLAFAIGDVTTDGRLTATGVPIQVAATAGDTRRLHLQVGDDKALSSSVDGTAFRATWQDYAGGHSDASKYARYLFGSFVLLVLFGFAFAAAWRERRRNGS